MKPVKSLLWIALVVIFGAIPARTQTKCPTDQVDTALPQPNITAVDITNSTVAGKVPAGTDKKIPTGNVQVCVDDEKQGILSAITGDGSFQVTSIAMKAGQKITAKYLPPPTAGGSQSYSLSSAQWLVGSCSKDASGAATLKAPVLTISVENDMASYSGRVPGATSGSVRICVNDLPQVFSVGIGSDGSFKGAATFKVKNGDQITAQAFTAAPSYGPVSSVRPISYGPLQVAGSPKPPDESSKVILIGGIEQAGYSSLTQNTEAFINAFISGPSGHLIKGWGRARLLSAPQPSTQGIVSVFTDPTGQLSTQDYTKVGQALDFVAGPQLRLTPRSNDPVASPKPVWSLIGEFGLSTPLNSQNVAVTYVAPPPGSMECTTLVNRFSAKNGYTPGLTPAPPNSTTCLAGGYTDVAFSNQDRSSFFIKYGAGFRSTNTINQACTTEDKECTPSTGVLDLTFGQDAAITRGILRHVVFKMDGMLPIPTGSASFVYVYGSAYLRLAKNQDYSPLILQTASGVTIPSSTVIVLPLQQPDRDFYRLGVGLNINQIFCKMFNSTCPSKPSTPATGTTSAKGQ